MQEDPLLSPTEEEALVAFYIGCAIGAVIITKKVVKALKKRSANKKIEKLDPVMKEKVLDMLAVHSEWNV